MREICREGRVFCQSVMLVGLIGNTVRCRWPAVYQTYHANYCIWGGSPYLPMTSSTAAIGGSGTSWCQGPVIKSEKKGWCWSSVLVTMLGYFLHGLCTFPKMVINMNIAVTSDKREYTQLKLLLMVLGYCWCGLCTFLNIVINANIAEKSWKSRKKRNRYDLDYHWYVKVLLMESGNRNDTWIQWPEWS